MASKRDALIASAEKSLQKGKVDSAVKDYMKVLEETPSDINILNKVGDLLVRMNRNEESIPYFTRIAEHYAKDGFTVKAIAMYKKVNKLDPARLEIYERLAELYALQGLGMEAKSNYQVLADYLLKQDDLPGAIGIYQKMAAGDPQNIGLRGRVAELLTQTKRIPEALKEYAAIAATLSEAGRPQEAIQVYEKALALAPDNVEILRTVAPLLISSGAIEEARKILRKALETTPRSVSLFLLAVEAALAANDLTEARSFGAKAQAVDPENEQVLGVMLKIHLKARRADLAFSAAAPLVEQAVRRGEARRAIAILTPIVRLAPENEDILRKISEVSVLAGDEASAQPFRSALAEVLRKQGRLNEAADELRACSRVAPDNAEFRARLAQIEPLLAPPPTQEPVASLEKHPMGVTYHGFAGGAPPAPRQPAPPPQAPPPVRDLPRPPAPPQMVAPEEISEFEFDIADEELVEVEEPVPPRSPASLPQPPPGFAGRAVQERETLSGFETPAPPPSFPRPVGIGPAGAAGPDYSWLDDIPPLSLQSIPLPSMRPGAPPPAQVPAPRPFQPPPLEEVEEIEEAHEVRDEVEEVPAARAPAGMWTSRGTWEVQAAEPAPAPREQIPGGFDLDDISFLEPGAPTLRADHPTPLQDPRSLSGPPSRGTSSDALVEEALVEAEVFRKYGLLEKAADQLKPLSTSKPGNVRIREKLFELYLEMGNRAAARGHAEFLAECYRKEGRSERVRGLESLLNESLPAPQPSPAPEAVRPPVPAADIPAPPRPPESLAPPPEPEGPVIEPALPEPPTPPPAAPRPLIETPRVRLEPAARFSILDELGIPSAPPARPRPSAPQMASVDELLSGASVGSGTRKVRAVTAADIDLTGLAPDLEKPARKKTGPVASSASPGPEDLLLSLGVISQPLIPPGTVKPTRVPEKPAPVEAAATEPEIAAPPPPVLPPASPSVSELADVDFCLEQGMVVDAAERVQALEARFPGHLDVNARRMRLEGARGGTDTPRPALHDILSEDLDSVLDVELGRALSDEMIRESAEMRVAGAGTPELSGPAMDESGLFSDEQEFFNFAEELQSELKQDPEPLPTSPDVSSNEVSLEEIFREFKKGVEQQLSPEDYETHYNLGIAYKEMGLTDEAIGEFQLASKDPLHAVECCSMLGLCFLEKGLPQLAVKWYRKGLETPTIKDEDRLGLQYDLASVFEQIGDRDAAYRTFVEIYGANASYRDVNDRIKALAGTVGN